MKVIIWKHGEAWAVKTVDGKRRMHGFESRACMALKAASKRSNTQAIIGKARRVQSAEPFKSAKWACKPLGGFF